MKQLRTYFYTPANLDLETLLSSEGIEVTPIQSDKYHYLLDSLYHRSFYGRDVTAESFLPVHAGVLQNVVGPKYATAIKQNLIRVGVLETDNRFVPGRKSKSYRIAEKYRDEFRPVPIERAAFAEKIARLQEKEEARVLESCPSFRYVHDSLFGLTIDADRAHQYVKKTHGKAPTGKENRELNSRSRQIARIAEKRWFVADDNQGRFYNNFVVLAKDLRPFTLLNGEAIYQADYSSLQPALLSCLYPSDCNERSKFVAVIKSGFYKFLEEYYPEDYNLADDDQKRAFKDIVFGHYLYCANRVQSPMREVFQREFPILSRLIKNEKQLNHAALPLKMQKLEARLIMQTVVPYLMETVPGIPLLTIHDCVATTEEYISAVKLAMVEAFNNLARFEIPVKVERISSY